MCEKCEKGGRGDGGAGGCGGEGEGRLGEEGGWRRLARRAYGMEAREESVSAWVRVPSKSRKRCVRGRGEGGVRVGGMVEVCGWGERR